jgi:hypothetical protein
MKTPAGGGGLAAWHGGKGLGFFFFRVFFFLSLMHLQ